VSQQRFTSALAACVAALEELGLSHAIIGGVAAISLGVARLTADIDVTIAAEAVDLDALLASLEQLGFERRLPDAAAFARQSQVLLLRHQTSQVPVDLILAWLPFELEMLAAVERRDFAGVSIPVPSATDLLIMKLVAHRPRDLEDAEVLARLPGIDFARAHRVLAEFCAVLEDEERLGSLARLERAAARPL
jgi:predicted nucleotidyltransferase